MPQKEHWDSVYATRASDHVSWFQAHAQLSLRLIGDTGAGKAARIIDVGGGAATLVDDLLDAGYVHLTVLDISATALACARARLGSRGDDIAWIAGDITETRLPRASFDVWHDRAVFHFLTDAGSRRAYVANALRAVRPGGHVIVSTFADDGPSRCSGLPVMRYRPEELHGEFGAAFELIGHRRENHLTPGGRLQKFVYCYCRIASGGAI